MKRSGVLIGQSLLELHAETYPALNLALGVDDSIQKDRRCGQASSSLLLEDEDAVMCMVQELVGERSAQENAYPRASRAMARLHLPPRRLGASSSSKSDFDHDSFSGRATLLNTQ